MSDDRPKRETMSVEEATVSNMWEIAAIEEWPQGYPPPVRCTSLRVFHPTPRATILFTERPVAG